MHTPTVIQTQVARLSGLEVLRFTSALSILLWHYQQFLFVGSSPIGLKVENQPFYGVFSTFYELGHLGVQVFWCISGFIFFHKYIDAISDKVVSARQFFWLRFSRLYPLHLVTLLFVAGIQLYRANESMLPFIYMKNDSVNFVGHIFMANGWFYFERFSFNGPVWSVSAEVLIYAAFFLAASRYSLTLASCLIVSTVCCIIMLAGARHASVGCLMLFFLGGAAHFVCEAFQEKPPKLLAFAVLLLIAGAFFYGIASGLVTYKPLVYLLLGLATAFLLIVLFHFDALFRPLGRLPEVLGSLTYASYLIHFPLKLAIVTIGDANGWKVPFYNPLFFVGWLTLVFTISWLVFRFFEVPAQNWIRQTSDVQRRVPAPVAAPQASI